MNRFFVCRPMEFMWKTIITLFIFSFNAYRLTIFVVGVFFSVSLNSFFFGLILCVCVCFWWVRCKKNVSQIFQLTKPNALLNLPIKHKNNYAQPQRIQHPLSKHTTEAKLNWCVFWVRICHKKAKHFVLFCRTNIVMVVARKIKQNVSVNFNCLRQKHLQP